MLLVCRAMDNALILLDFLRPDVYQDGSKLLNRYSGILGNDYSVFAVVI